jgi:anaerobic ribonucleoside-triphosphate reductase activating protein
MNYASIKDIDIQDGDGVRVALYVSGCHFHCKECHNKEAWDFNYGEEFTEKDIEHIINSMDHDYISGLSILGGEPLELVNQKGLLPLVERVREKFPEKNIWLYTGYQFDKDVLEDMYKKYDFTKKLIDNLDIVVDGQFVIEKKITDLKQRGSYNQRKIDVKQSIMQNKAVCLKFGDEYKYENKKEPKKIFVGEKEEKAEVIPMPVFTEIPIENIDQAVEKIIIHPAQEEIAASGIDKKLK